MKAHELDAKFDSDGDISAHLELAKARRPNLTARRVNVDFPAWMVDELDQEARKLGITRQSLIKMWLADKIERRSANSF
jgi:CopG antitoxin of type II toxin-antitoxin system